MTNPSDRALTTWRKALDAYCDSTRDDVPLGDNDEAAASLIDAHVAAETKELQKVCKYLVKWAKKNQPDNLKWTTDLQQAVITARRAIQRAESNT